MSNRCSVPVDVRQVTVLGAGAFGTALATALLRAKRGVRLWGRDDTVIAGIAGNRQNARYLPDIDLPDTLVATSDWASEGTTPDLLLLVTPAQTTRSLVRRIADTPVYARCPLVLCAKGIDQSNGQLLSDIVRETLPDTRVAVLSGPSFASDVARGLPTAVSVAADDLADAASIAAVFTGSGLRCYANDDVRGVELGGALKNVLAIAAGIVRGCGLGASAQAALITRGLVEMRQLAVAMGAHAETVSGLSGLGDLILTCASVQSRNFSYGIAVGRGDVPDGLPLAEGVYTAGIAAQLAENHQIEAPIIATVSAVLDKRLPVDDAITALLARPLRVEA